MVDGEVYMIPNVGGTSGIIYNPEEVPQGVDSYRDLFEDPALAGQVTLEDSAATVIAITALALGHEDPFALTEEDITEIKDYLIEHKSAIRALFKGDADFLSLYRTGEIIAGFGYHDYRAAMTREEIPVEFVPGEGSLAWICGMSLSANTQNEDAAYAAMNHYISPQTQSFYAETYTYLVSDQRTLDELKPALVEELGLDDPSASWMRRSRCNCRRTTTCGSMPTESSKPHERERDERGSTRDVATLGGRREDVGDLEPEDDRQTPDGGSHLALRRHPHPDRRQLRRVAGRDAPDQVGMTGAR